MKKLLIAGAAMVALITGVALADQRTDNELHVVQALNGNPNYQTTMTGSTLQTYTTTSDGILLMLSCDSAVYIGPGTSVTAANGVPLAAAEKFWMMLLKGQSTISMLPVTGTSNCKVFWMQ